MIATATTTARLTITPVRSATPSKMSAPDRDYSVHFSWCACCTPVSHPPEETYDASRSVCDRCCIVLRARGVGAGEQHERSSEGTNLHAGTDFGDLITTRLVNEHRLEPRVGTGATAAPTPPRANTSARCACTVPVFPSDERAAQCFRVSWSECIAVPARGRQCGCIYAPGRQRRTVAHTRAGRPGESVLSSARSGSAPRSCEPTTTDALVHR